VGFAFGQDENATGGILTHYIENADKKCFLSDTCEIWTPR